MRVFLLFERKWARVYLGPTENETRVVTFRPVAVDPQLAQRAREGVVAALRDLAWRAV